MSSNARKMGRINIALVGAMMLQAVGAAYGVTGRPPELILADQGRANLPIVISEKAADSTRQVAKELADYLSRISGAPFEVQTGDGSRGIVLGTLAAFPHAELAPSLAIHNTYDGKEAYAIRTERQRLLLIGATDLGVPHAAMRLLDHLGCRWFFPAKEWEVVPSAHKLSVALDETDRPCILARRIWYGYGTFLDKGHPRGGNTQQDYEAWMRHNRLGGSFRVQAGHAWQGIILANKKTFEQHPEYLALVKGQRQGEQLCVSNPAVRRLASDYVLANLKKRPEAEMTSLECSDGDGQCECAQCAKLGSISDRVFGLANEVAREVHKELPGRMVGCLAYNQHSEPPSVPIEPNLYVQLCAGFIRGPYSHEQLLELWPKKCKNLGFYEYFSVWLWDFDKLPGGNAANLKYIRDRIRRYRAAGATSIDAESGNNWGVHGRGYYIAGRLMWNPDADVDSLLADFYEQAFGPAAPAMRHYYERIAAENEPLLSRGLLGEALRDVDEATSRARGRPDVLARIDQLKHYLRYIHLRWLIDHEKDKAKRKDISVAALTLVYRTRYEYMNHWAAMRTTWAEALSKDYNEPTWKFNDHSPKPWIVETRVSRAETDRWFREALEYFQPTPASELKFSDDLVPVAFSSSRPGAALQHAYQRPAHYALCSRKGEPLDIEITPGIIAWYRDRADARYWLRDMQRKVVAEGRLKLDGQPHKLQFKVPAPGTYFFDCDDSSAGWRIKVEPGRSAALVNIRGRQYLCLGQMQEMYFYVPKGTRVLQYFWRGGPHKVLGPDRKAIQEVDASDEVISVAVPKGFDGRCWSLSARSHQELWFFNAPNYLAASPETLLLPREVVGRDGLQPVTK